MATTVLAPSRYGILLNASPTVSTMPLPHTAGADYTYTGSWPKRSPRYATTPLPAPSSAASSSRAATASSGPSAPSSSSSTQSSPYSSPRTGPRKIRFAPLPDPRRAVLITDSGEELPLPVDDDEDDDEPKTPSDLPNQAVGEWAAICALKTDSPVEEAQTPLASAKQPTSPYPGSSALPSDDTPLPPPSPAPTSFLGKAKRALMKPLTSSPAKETRGRTQSTGALVDARLGSSLDDLRGFGLWRVESRDSMSTAGGGSRASSRERTPSVRSETFGAPLSRSQSSSSAKRPSRRPPPRSSLLPFRRSNSDPKVAAAPANNGGRGIRMLNGRVYGAKKHAPIEQKNPFATARTGDEFVEWGYGGAGSVKTAKQLGVSSNSALQGNSRVTIGHTGADHHNDVDSDDNDGSGLTWIRKRREAREREAAEKRAREEAQAEVAVPPPSIAEESAAEGEGSTPQATEPTAVPLPVSPTGDEYVHTSLLVPAPHWEPAEGPSTPSSDEGGTPSPATDEGGEDVEAPRATSIGASVEIVSRHKH